MKERGAAVSVINESQSVCSALLGGAKSGRGRKERRRGEEEENKVWK